MPWFRSCLQLNMTYDLFRFTKNNSSTIEDMKNLSTKMNYTGLIIPQTELKSTPMKDDNHFQQDKIIYSKMILSCVWHYEVRNFGADYFKYLYSYSLETFLNWS